MVYSKRDSKGQESGGNHDVRNKTAGNRSFCDANTRPKHYLNQPYIENTNALHGTDYLRYQDSVNGRKPNEEKVSD